MGDRGHREPSGARAGRPRRDPPGSAVAASGRGGGPARGGRRMEHGRARRRDRQHPPARALVADGGASRVRSAAGRRMAGRPPRRRRPLPRPPALFVLQGAAALAAGAALTTWRRAAGAATPGLVVAPALVVATAGIALIRPLPERLPLFPIWDFEEWALSAAIWWAVLAGALGLLAVALTRGRTAGRTETAQVAAHERGLEGPPAVAMLSGWFPSSYRVPPHGSGCRRVTTRGRGLGSRGRPAGAGSAPDGTVR